MALEKESKTLQPIVVMVEQPSPKPVPVRPHLRHRIKQKLAVSQNLKDKKARRLKAMEPPPEFKEMADNATTLADYLESMERAEQEAKG